MRKVNKLNPWQQSFKYCFSKIYFASLAYFYNFQISELHHKNLVSSLPAYNQPPNAKRNKHMKVMQPKVIINKLNPIKIESMDIDAVDVKIEEAPPIIPKVESVLPPEPNATATSAAVPNHALKKNASLKKSGKDTPRKFVLTKGESTTALLFYQTY